MKEYVSQLTDADAAAVVAAMKDVEHEGLRIARHVRGDIYEVRAEGKNLIFRILFAAEGRYNQILLALEGFSKKTRKTPLDRIELAERRLSDWRHRGM